MGIIQKQGIQNTIISYIGIIIGFVNVLILQPIMLSADEIGLTRILFSIATLFATIFPLGLNGVLVKFIPEYRKEPDNKGFLGYIMLLSLSFFILFSIIFYIFKNSFFSIYYNNSRLLWEFSYYVLPISMFIGFSNLLGVYLFSTFRSTIPTLVNDVVIRIYSVLITSLYFLHLFSLFVYVFLFALGFLLQLIVLLFYITKKDGKGVFSLSNELKTYENFRRFMKFAFSMSLITISSMAMKNIDVLMIGKYLSLKDVAVYSIAILISSLIELPASALGKVADGKISDYFLSNDWENLRKIYFQSTKILFYVGCFLFLLINVNIIQLLNFLPSKYQNGAVIVNIVSLSALSNMSTGINSSMLLYTNKNKQITILLIALVLLMITLNLFLIPSFGLKGAAFSVAISFILFNSMKSAMIYYYFKLNPFDSFFLKICIITILSYVSISLIKCPIGMIDIIVKSILSALVFALILIVNPSLSEEKQKLWNFFKFVLKK